MCSCGVDALGDCEAKVHECVCYTLAPCLGAKHVCVCRTRGSETCRGEAHECVCYGGDPKGCRGEEAHKCVCYKVGPKGCRGEEAHECVCYKGDPKGCRCTCEHYCSCCEVGPESCRIGEGGRRRVDRTCKENGPVPCRSTSWHFCASLSERSETCRVVRHNCSCLKFGWRSCRAWGEHDNMLTEARGVRALVVSSYGSAPSAELVGSPVLSGFASLPYQLRLYVAETAWVIAATRENTSNRRG